MKKISRYVSAHGPLDIKSDIDFLALTAGRPRATMTVATAAKWVTTTSFNPFELTHYRPHVFLGDTSSNC